MNKDGSVETTIGFLKNLSALMTPALLVLVGYLQLAEERRALTRWETPAFERRVEEIIYNTDLVTKSDIYALEKEIQRLSRKVDPVFEYLIREGLTEERQRENR